MAIEYEFDDEGITAMEVTASPNREYQGVSYRLRYEFAGPVDFDYLNDPAHDTFEVAWEFAEQELDQVVAKRKAEEKAAREQQRSSSKGSSSKKSGGTKKSGSRKRKGRKKRSRSADSDDGGIQWEQASKPNNSGTLRYRSTDDLSPDAFKAMIEEALEAEGEDPDDFDIFDERIGKYGLESGNKRYSAASVKPNEDNPAYDEMLGTSRKGNEFVKGAFWVDFQDDGTVSVRATDAYEDALDAVDDEDEDDDIPF